MQGATTTAVQNESPPKSEAACGLPCQKPAKSPSPGRTRRRQLRAASADLALSVTGELETICDTDRQVKTRSGV